MALTENNALPGQPITFGGVASFATRPLRRVLLFHWVTAAVATLLILWCFCRTWLPIVDAGVDRLPDVAAIQVGALAWPDTSSQILSANEFLGIAVDPNDLHDLGQTSDVQLELGKTSLRIRSLLGTTQLEFDPALDVSLGHTDASSWWGARRPFIVGGFALGVFFGLLLTWILLATLHLPLIWLMAFLSDRALNWKGAWKIGAIGLLPGAVILTGGIVLYGLRELPLAGLLVVFLLHFAVDWSYFIIAPLRLSARIKSIPLKGNPFSTNPAAPVAPPANPFATPPPVPSAPSEAPAPPPETAPPTEQPPSS